METNHVSGPTDLDRVEELFAFLQGTIPAGFTIPPDEIPHLTPEQAWTVIWYLGNLYWQVPDYIERCDECGDLYDTRSGGTYREEPPYHLCDNCDTDY
jgi:hypothetical protein